VRSRLQRGRGEGLSLAAAVFALLAFVQGCSGHSERTLPVRSALDAGNPREAIAHVNKELGVDSDKDLPNDIQGDNALLVLDRASIQQSLAQYKLSEQDFQAADKAIDMLDLAHNAGDSIGKYVFSDSAGRYVAPPYEKLLINTLNMINYLETQDLSGAKIEARRLAVMQRYLKDQLQEKDNAILGLGGFLAGLAYEKSGDLDEALRWYDEALVFSGFGPLSGPVARLAQSAQYTSPRIKEAIAKAGNEAPLGEDEGEIVFVLGYGRVPHKIPERVPIGLALTLVAGDISPGNAAQANKLAAQGLVTWVNYPSLAPEQGQYTTPACVLDGKYVQVEQAVNVSSQVRVEWKKIEGKIILSAITRLIARVAAGQAIQKAGNDSIFAFLLSLGTQATLTALDTPDTRSWETLPARIAIARVRVKAGQHDVTMEARGVSRKQTVDVPKGGWALASLMALR
jgi:tetratricopeptide (TPR) repeat protein